MPVISPESYGRKPRHDGLPGFIVVTPTKQAYVEADGADVRLDRVRVFGPNGLEKSFLRDKIGQRFVDNLPGTEDDSEYVANLGQTEYE